MTSGEFKSFPIPFIFVVREERQRRELKGIEELAKSINEVGLIHPIVIQRDGRLIAGERRFTAMKQLGWTNAPVQFVDELDEVQLHLLELEENVRREDLTWQEECLAIERYHALRAEIDPDWNEEDTAVALNISSQQVNDKRMVAKKLERGDKQIAEAPKFSVARGITKRQVEREKASVIATISRKAEPDKPQAPLILADFNEWQRKYEGPKFNFIHCDFPYGINAGEHDQGAAAAHGGYEDSASVYSDLLETLEAAMNNVVAESAHLLFWFSMTRYQYTLDFLQGMGWTVNPWPLIWHKNDNTGILPDPHRGPRQIYETAFLASRGDRKIVRAVSNLFAHPGHDKSIHMSEKPVPMLQHFMRMFVDEYSTVLDPTCGSGNSLKAARALGAKSVLGLEKDQEFFNRATEAYFGTNRRL